MEGWIRLHRNIKDHWIWKSDNRLKWWLDILLSVNHSDSKVLIKGTLIDCKRGQSIKSLESWARDWNVSKGSVRDFFKLLTSDQMLHTESLQFTTRITVLNYDTYQGELYVEETQKKRRGNAKETLRVPKQECKEGINNDKNDNNKSSDFIDKIIDVFSEEYFRVNQVEYSIISKGKERAAVGKILSLHKAKNASMTSEQTIESLRLYFKMCISINNDWIRNNMSLPIIVSKFNEINNILKNGKKRNVSTGATDAELAGIITKHFATDRVAE